MEAAIDEIGQVDPIRHSPLKSEKFHFAGVIQIVGRRPKRRGRVRRPEPYRLGFNAKLRRLVAMKLRLKWRRCNRGLVAAAVS